MKILFRLIRLKLLSPASLLLLYRAKKVHGHNICFLLHYAARRYGNRIAMTDGTTMISFQEMYEKVLTLSEKIHAGINSDEQVTVILVCSNSIRSILTHHAIQNLGIKLILVHHKTHLNEIIKIRDRQSANTYIFYPDKPVADLPNTISINDLFDKEPITQPEKIISKEYEKLSFPTSGTTGEPKIIRKKTGLFHSSHLFADLIFQTGAYKRKAIFIAAPFSHSFGYSLMMFALVLGIKATVTDEKEPIRMARLIIDEKVDLLAGTPTSLYLISEYFKPANHHVNLVISCGAPMNNIILRQVTDSFGKNIFSLYGSTEASTSFIAGYDHLKKNCCSLGNPLKGIKYHLGDGPGEARELLINSPAANISSLEWISTGDYVKLDAEKNMVWCGRKDNMILKNGINIYPAEIENALLEIPFIEDVYISGEKHSTKGEIIIAYLKLKRGYILNERELRTLLSLSFSQIKIPDKFIEFPVFEFTNTGKKIKPVLLNIQ